MTTELDAGLDPGLDVQDSRVAMAAEGLLRDHVRDREGTLRDLMVLAHHVDDTWSGMATVGLEDALGGEPG